METTIAIPSTYHALLPALALMAGHSNATTTLSSYTHLIDYWQWLTVEMEFKKVKTLDGTLSSLAKINRKHLTVEVPFIDENGRFITLTDLSNRKLPVFYKLSVLVHNEVFSISQV
ncbi:hypothetical protein V6259_17270 [Marinomonas sp. TI.3.20]|uniref:hypothetical protein n=1 Tax=Marinomonas sp. TI.3.20 TaxID=3121296 RepID=UPI00312023D5